MCLHRRFLAPVCSLLLNAFLATHVALATDFIWTGLVDNEYFNSLNWLPFDPGVVVGPPKTNDTATISNGDFVTVTGHFAVADQINGLTLSGGSTLDNDGTDSLRGLGWEIIVDANGTGLTQLSGSGTELRIWPNSLGTSSDGFDTDLMTINSGAKVVLINGRLEVDSGKLDMNTGATLVGYGWIDLEATSLSPFTVLENDGLIHVARTTISGVPLTLTITASDVDARIDLDGTSGNGAVQIDENGWLGMNAPLADAFDGQITLGRNTVFQMTDSWTNNTGGVIDVNAGTGTAAISVAAPNTFTNNGTINVNSGTLVMASNYVDNGTTIHVNGTGLRLEGNSVINNPDFQGAYQLNVGSGSNTTINAGAFNWDGDDNAHTTVDGVLTLDVDSVDTGNNVFNGMLSQQGVLNVNLTNPLTFWTIAGQWNVMSSPGVTPASQVGRLLLAGETNFSGSGTATIAGDIIDVIGTMHVNSGVTAQIDASAQAAFLSGSQTTIEQNAVLQVETLTNFGGTVTLEGGELIVNASPATAWTNNGVINVDSAVGPSRIAGGDFTNNGTINVNSGTLVIDANFVDNANTINVAGNGSPAALRLEKNATINHLNLLAGAGLQVGPGSQTTVNAPNFDWDADVTVEEGGVLTVLATSPSGSATTGTLSIQGGQLNVNFAGPAGNWTTTGTVNLGSSIPNQPSKLMTDGLINVSGVVNFSGPNVSRLAADEIVFNNAVVNVCSGCTAITMPLCSRLDGTTVNVFGTGILQLEGTTVFGATSQLNRSDMANVIVNGDATFEGGLATAGGTTVIGDG